MDLLLDAQVVLWVPRRVPNMCRKRAGYVLLAPVFEQTNHFQEVPQLMKRCLSLYKPGAVPNKFILHRHCRYYGASLCTANFDVESI
jgi:hypothetical protein